MIAQNLIWTFFYVIFVFFVHIVRPNNTIKRSEFFSDYPVYIYIFTNSFFWTKRSFLQIALIKRPYLGNCFNWIELRKVELKRKIHYYITVMRKYSLQTDKWLYLIQSAKINRFFLSRILNKFTEFLLTQLYLVGSYSLM